MFEHTPPPGATVIEGQLMTVLFNCRELFNASTIAAAHQWLVEALMEAGLPDPLPSAPIVPYEVVLASLQRHPSRLHAWLSLPALGAAAAVWGEPHG